MTVISRLRDADFEVFTREQWGSAAQRAGAYAKRAASSYYRLNDPLPYHYLHISVTSDTDTVQEGAAGARQIEGYGYSTPPMVSYQMLVTNEGKLFEGQNYGVKGTHTVNDNNVPGFPEDLNRYGYAVALMQNVGDEVTDVQVVAVAAAFAAAELEGHVKRGAPIFPHRKFAPKSCPGDKAVARLGEIQRLKDQMVQRGSITQEDDMADAATQKTLKDTLSTVKRLERKFDRFRERATIRHQATVKAVDALEAEVKDDAGKAQVRALRDLIEALHAAEMAAETEAEEAL